MTEDNNEQPAEADGNQDSLPQLSAGYDSYRSLVDSNLVIFVPKHATPPLRFTAGGWELLQSSVDLSPRAKARVDEEGFLIETINPASSDELIPSDHDGPAPPSLEVEFALVIARMIESVKNSPEDLRHVIYDLARYKLQEQLPHANAVEKNIRGGLWMSLSAVSRNSQRSRFRFIPRSTNRNLAVLPQRIAGFLLRRLNWSLKSEHTCVWILTGTLAVRSINQVRGRI